MTNLYATPAELSLVDEVASKIVGAGQTGVILKISADAVRLDVMVSLLAQRAELSRWTRKGVERTEQKGEYRFYVS